jgi:hypothetical protein
MTILYAGNPARTVALASIALKSWIVEEFFLTVGTEA